MVEVCRGEGRFDHVRIERFTINEADTLNSTFGNTGRPNPSLPDNGGFSSALPLP